MHSRMFSVGMLCVLTAVSTAVHAADLVTATVDDTERSRLVGYRPAWTATAADTGRLADDVALTHLVLVLRQPPARKAALDTLLDEQQDPASPQFHHWLTPSEFGERFGATPHDIDAVVAWLASQGLQVDAVANGRTRIAFSGAASTVSAAFGTELHGYTVGSEARMAPAREPTLPAALSNVVDGVLGLYTVPLQSFHHSASTNPAAANQSGGQPDATFCSGTCNFLFPADFATIYDIGSLYRQGADGRGQTIAIAGRSRVYHPDIDSFQSLSGLPIKYPTVIVPPNGIDPGPAASSGSPDATQGEATLDVTRANSVAPGADIVLVISANSASVNGIQVAAEYVVDTSPVLAHILSISFGNCETNAGSTVVDFFDNVFTQGAAEGISVFVSAGDSGAASCDTHGDPPPATQSLSTNAICSSSHATCVGGTDFNDANPSAYWSATNGSGYGSALGYIPEGSWNQPTVTNGGTTTYQVLGSGGGVSVYIPTPSWQTGTGVPSGRTGRYTPDIAFHASGHNGYALCLASNGHACTVNGAGRPDFQSEYGTSASTPSMAGITALLNDEMGGAQGELNAHLYQLAKTTNNGVFHDVTVATSGVTNCDVATPSLCNNSTPAPDSLTGGLAGYVVGTGYDEVTGLGSLDVANFVAHWAAKTDLLFRNGFETAYP
jgi:pseudomonalisin